MVLTKNKIRHLESEPRSPKVDFAEETIFANDFSQAKISNVNNF